MPLEEVFLSDKVRELENKHSKLELLIEHLTDSIDDIRTSIREALDLKGRVEGYGGQLNQLWPRVDELRKDLNAMDKKVESLLQAHNTCQAAQREERQWRAQRAGSLADKLIWVAVIVIAAGAAILAIKGYLK